MPGAPKPTILDDVHRSCKAVVDASPQLVTLDTDAVTAYAAGLDAAAVKAAAAKSGIGFPIKFDSQEAEVTFLALYHLLDLGSGFDALLRASSAKRGWKETMQYGCFGLALAAKRLDGPWMRAFSLYNLHTAFGFDSKVEEQLQPGITISKPGPLTPLAAAIHDMIVGTGKALEAAGAKSLGGLILEHLDGLKAAGKPITAASLIEELADTIPGFQDSALFTPPAAAAAAGVAAGAGAAAVSAGGSSGGSKDGPAGSSGSSIKVVFLRKAQALAAELGLRFGREDPRFAFTDAAQLAADSGPVLAAVLQHLGLVKCSEQLAATSQQQQQLPAGTEQRALRAAAVAAVDAVVAAAAAAAAGSSADAQAAASVSAWELSSYLLAQVKDEEGSGQLVFDGAVLKPYSTQDTTAY